MQRAGFVLIGVLVLSLVATGLAEATMALGHRSVIVDRPALTPLRAPSSTARPAGTPTATPVPTPTPSVTPTPVPAALTAITTSFVHMRAGASTATAIVYDLDAGAVVTLGGYSDTQWQQASFNGFNGYVFKAYLRY